MDFNVVPPFWRRGLGTALLDVSENEAATRSAVVGRSADMVRRNGDTSVAAMSQTAEAQHIAIRWPPPYRLEDDLLLWVTQESREGLL